MSTTAGNKYNLFKLTIPVFIEIFMQILVGNIDQLMLSKYSDVAVAAVGNANQIINVLILVFSVISLATTIMVSQNIGAENFERVSQIYVLALTVNLILGIAVGGILISINGCIFQIMRAPLEIIADARIYLLFSAASLPFQAVYQTFTSIFRSNALMKYSMRVSIVMNVLNIIGNFLLINGIWIFPQLGVMGVAISTFISRAVGVALMIVFFRKHIKAKLTFKYLKPFPTNLLKWLVCLGLPSGGEAFSYNFSQMVCLSIVNTLGTAIVTTKMYASLFAWFSYIYGCAVSQASQIIVGYFIGAKEYEDADKQTMGTLFKTLPITIILSVSVFLCSDFLFGFFTNDPEILKYGKIVMGIDIALEFGRTFNMILVRALQAAGDVTFPVVIGIASQWLIAVGGAYLFGVVFNLGLAGVWIGMALDELIRGMIFLVRWKSKMWISYNTAYESD